MTDLITCALIASLCVACYYLGLHVSDAQTAVARRDVATAEYWLDQARAKMHEQNEAAEVLLRQARRRGR